MPTRESTDGPASGRRAALRACAVSITGSLAGCLRPLLEDGAENESATAGSDVPTANGSSPSAAANEPVVPGWESFYDEPGPVEIVDGTVVAAATGGSGPATVVGIELETGEQAWEFSTTDEIERWAVAAGHGNVYATATIGETLHRTYVVERGSGALAATVDLEVPGSTDDRIYDPQPAVVTSDRAIVGTGRWSNDIETRVQAIDATRSEAVWTVEPSGLLYRGGVAYDERAYLAVGGLVRVDPTDGSHTNLDDSIFPSPGSRPVRRGDVVYVLGRSPSGTRTLYALSLPDGDRLWSYDTGSETFSSSEYGGPAPLDDGGAVVPVAGTLYAIGPDGTERWTASIGGDSGVRPVVVDGTIVVLRGDGLAGYDPGSGEPAFEHGTVSAPQAAATDGERLVCSLAESVTRFEVEI